MAVAISNPGGAIAGQAASGNVATYSGVDIGAAAADRIVAVCVGTELTNSGPTACTIDFGGGHVAMTAGSLGTQGAVNARIFYLRVPTGTSAEFRVTYGATDPTANQARIGVLRIVGADVRLVSQGQVADTDADPITTGAVTVPTNGGKLVSYAAAATTARTWTGVTEDLDVNATDFRFSTGFINGGGSITTTVSGGNAEDAALSYIVLMESPTPVLPWRHDPPAVFTKSVLPVAVVAAGLIWSGFTPPPPVGDGSVEFAQTETIVPYERVLLYPSLQEPPLQNLAELITLDKWFRPLAEPTRWRGLLPASQPDGSPDPFPRPIVDEYRWHRPLAEPTRRVPTVYPQSELNDPYPPVVDEYRWHRPLAEPTRRIPTVYPQSALNDPFPRTVVDDYRWHRPLSEPVRIQPRPMPELVYSNWIEQQELVTLDKWYIAWRDVPRRVVDLSSHLYAAFNLQPPTVAEDVAPGRYIAVDWEDVDRKKRRRARGLEQVQAAIDRAQAEARAEVDRQRKAELRAAAKELNALLAETRKQEIALEEARSFASALEAARLLSTMRMKEAQVVLAQLEAAKLAAFEQDEDEAVTLLLLQ